MSGTNAQLAAAYLDGEERAVRILDAAVLMLTDTAWVRAVGEEELDATGRTYDEIRNDLDQLADSLTEDLVKAKLMPTAAELAVG